MVPLTQGAIVELTIDRPVAGGRMLARLGGQVVLVTGAIPGETVRARIERVGRVVLASACDILTPSSSRRAPAYDASCGGAAYAHIAYEAQPALKEAVIVDALRHGARIAWTTAIRVHTSHERGYRMKARLRVRGARPGFLREGTHEICNAADTGQLLEGTMPAVEGFLHALPRPVLESLDAIELAENLPGTERVLHLSWTERSRVPRVLVEAIRVVDGVTGVTVTDRATGLPVPVDGRAFVADQVPAFTEAPTAEGSGAVLQRHAPAFFQANRFLLRELVAAVLRQVPDGPVVDLYSGVGLFAIALAARGQPSVTAVEGDPVSGSDLSANATAFGARITVHREGVESWSAQERLDRETTIVLDPPRTGLSRPALDGLLALRAPRLVYVSCDVATLARDVRLATGAGYRLTHLEAFDLFPNTAHVETLAVLSR